MKAPATEKFVDGVRIDNASVKSAHGILADHVTNVSPVTAQVIGRALEEYSSVLEQLASRPAAVLATPTTPAIDECEKALRQLIDATDLLAMAVAKIRNNTIQAIEKVVALRAPLPLSSADAHHEALVVRRRGLKKNGHAAK